MTTHRRRIAALTLAALTTAVAACGATTPSTAPATAAPAASEGATAAPAASDPLQGHEPVTITVGALRPGAAQAAADALNLQISQFEALYPWIDAESEEYNWTAPTFTAALAGGTLPDVFTIPFTDGKGLISQTPDRQHRRASPGARLCRRLQPHRPRQRPGRRRGDLRRADPGLRHVADLQPQPVRAGRPRPGRAAHDVGRGPGRGQDDRGGDGRRRPRHDGHPEHRRLAAHHRDLRPRRADDRGGRGRHRDRDPQQPPDQGRPRVPQGAALGGQLDGRDLRLQLGHDQPGVHGRPARHVHRRLGPVHATWSRTTA